MKSLIEFIDKYVHSYSRTVKGAPQKYIIELETILGRALPKPLYDFLSTMGTKVGFDTSYMDFHIKSVLSLTSRWEPIPARFFPLAKDSSPVSYDYYLDMETQTEDGDALVVRISEGMEMLTEQLPIWWSLRDMIFSIAFERVRGALLPEKKTILWVEEQISHTQLTSSMQNLGFEVLNVTSPKAQLYERGDCAACIYQAPFEDSLSLNISAKNSNIMSDIIGKLTDEYSLNSGKFKNIF